jgi:hypothetical protein
LIKRIATVLWWIGAIFLALAVLSYGKNLWATKGCNDVFVEQKSLEQQAEAITSKAIEQDAKHPSNEYQKRLAQLAPESRNDPNITAFIRPNVTITTIKDLPRREDFDSDLQRCESHINGPLDSTIYDSIFFGLIFLVIAYILGGSFMRPPTTKE